MPSGARAVPGNSMIKAVFDTNILVSAFLSRDNPGGVSSELLRFVVAGAIDLHLSIEIVDEGDSYSGEQHACPEEVSLFAQRRRRIPSHPDDAGDHNR